MKTINVIQQIKEFKNIISYSKNIGFFFGAGTSCAFGLPAIVTLTSMVEDKLDLEPKTDYLKAKYSLMKLTGKVNVSIEEILNYIRQIRDITHEMDDKCYEDIYGNRAKDLDKAICQCIFNIIKTLEQTSDISYLQKFFAWYDTTCRNYIKEIFTTNYDMLFERSMEANKIPYFDGFVGSYEPFFWPESIENNITTKDLTANWIRLWKIHGSLNWELKPATATSAVNIMRVGKIDVPHNELLIYPTKEKYDLSRKQPFIAYFDRLKNYLAHNELLFVVAGYSFSDQHINEVILNCLRQNARLFTVVFCYEDSQVSEMESLGNAYLNMCVMGPKTTIINGKMYAWEFDDKDDDDKNSYLFWNDSEKKMILGDFLKLIDFFVENSGRRSMIEEAVHAK